MRHPISSWSSLRQQELLVLVWNGGGQTVICFKWLQLLTDINILFSVSKLVLSILPHFVELAPYLFEMAFSIKVLIEISNVQHFLCLRIIKWYGCLMLYGAIPLGNGSLTRCHIRYLILNHHEFGLLLLLLVITWRSVVPGRNDWPIRQHRVPVAQILRNIILVKLIINDPLLLFLLSKLLLLEEQILLVFLDQSILRLGI